MKRIPLKRRVRLRRVNWARLKARRAKQFGPQAAMCRSMGCLACGSTPCDPHHVKSRGAGGRDEDCVPLCRWHHDYIHSAGRDALEHTWGIDLDAALLKLRALVALNLRAA